MRSEREQTADTLFSWLKNMSFEGYLPLGRIKIIGCSSFYEVAIFPIGVPEKYFNSLINLVVN
jgi:hypothetical protein